MNKQEVSNILDEMNERSVTFKDPKIGLQTTDLVSFKLYENIHRVKSEVYSILSYKNEISIREFLEIYHKYVIEGSQKYIVKDIIRKVCFDELGL